MLRHLTEEDRIEIRGLLQEERDREFIADRLDNACRRLNKKMGDRKVNLFIPNPYINERPVAVNYGAVDISRKQLAFVATGSGF